MRELYSSNSANYPRLATDVFFADYSNTYDFMGYMDTAIRFIEDFQLINPQLWRRFVQQFREDADYDAGWRGEYWGKMIRGACFTYSYTKNPALYETLAQTVCDIIDSQDELGRISSYTIDHEFDGWDIWSRKYVLLGLQYFMEICDDENLNQKIIDSMKKQADYIMSKIGPAEEGKKPITIATRHWRGLNSSSLLEPIVRLYTITGEKKYFDYATYIVNEGGTDVVNIFNLAYEDKFLPYQYPVTKAYEMTSCFEGLLEYYRHTKEERLKVSVINFANRILESDFTIIGSCGCTHELFDHSTVRQANTTNGKIAQETCVTVTLMKFMYQLTLITGDPKYVDAFEISLYNAYLGSINTEKVTEPMIKSEFPNAFYEPLPFDSYSPLTAGTRGNGVGGIKLMSDNHYYGCCACIGSAGNGLAPKMTLLSTEKGFAYNLFFHGVIKSTTPAGNEIMFMTNTTYPKGGNVKVTMILKESEEFEILLRNPAWSRNSTLKINGNKVDVNKGYISINRLWSDGDCFEFEIDMQTRSVYPVSYGKQILMTTVVWGHNYVVPTYDEEDIKAKNHIALMRGPIVLAQENRLGYSVDDPVDIKVNDDGSVDVVFPEEDSAPYMHMIEVDVPLKNGGTFKVTDYASAGKLWTEESKMAAWMLTE